MMRDAYFRISYCVLRVLFHVSNSAFPQKLFARIIDDKHPFKRLNEILDFKTLIAPMRATYSTLGANGIDVESGLKALLIQFWENYSDREMEKTVRKHRYSLVLRIRPLGRNTRSFIFRQAPQRIGTKRVADFF